jgi:hypothetical protein
VVSRRGVTGSPDPGGVSVQALSSWCQVRLGSHVDALLFEAGFGTRVYALRLRDSREVVVKVRPYTARLRGTAAVHAHLWQCRMLRWGWPIWRLVH